MDVAVASPRDAEPRHLPAPPQESDPASIERYLLGFEWPDQNRAVYEALVEDGLPLWLEILRTVPQPRERGRLLELGSPPFDITLLVQKFRNYDLTLAAAVADGRPRFHHRVANRTYGETYDFDCVCFDIEREPFPFPDQQFDVVMWCEVIEHLTENPVFTLSEIHRVLKPGGSLVISTPNVTRVENVLRMLVGLNVYDPYHLGTPFRGSRHSREYTLRDLKDVIGGCGFRLAVAEARNLTASIGGGFRPTATRPRKWKSIVFQWLKRPLAVLLNLSGYVTRSVYGDHLFVRAVKEGPFCWNFPPTVFDEGHVLWYQRVRDREVVMGRNEVPHTTLGWGPLETGPEGKSQRRAGPVADAYLVAQTACRSVVVELAGAGTTTRVDVEVWQGAGEAAAWLTSGYLDAPPGRWSRLEIPLGPEARAGEEFHLRIKAASGVYVHRMVLEP